MVDHDDLVRTEESLGYTFKDLEILKLALTHASVAQTRLESNERLEFLGDAVLGLMVCEQIFRTYPHLLEGDMTKIKSAVVSRQMCAQIALQLGLDQQVALGKGMKLQRRLPQSVAAASLESVIAAIYLDGGLESVTRVFEPLLRPLLDQVASCGHQQNFKSVLQQHVQQRLHDTPNYRILDEKGPDHAKCFKVCVEVQGRCFEPSWGQSKKQAEQCAALNALRELDLIEQTDDGLIRIRSNGDCQRTALAEAAD